MIIFTKLQVFMNKTKSFKLQSSLRSLSLTRLVATLLLIIAFTNPTDAQNRTHRSLSAQDDAFLEDLSRDHFGFSGNKLTHRQD